MSEGVAYLSPEAKARVEIDRMLSRRRMGGEMVEGLAALSEHATFTRVLGAYAPAVQRHGRTSDAARRDRTRSSGMSRGQLAGAAVRCGARQSRGCRTRLRVMAK